MTIPRKKKLNYNKQGKNDIQTFKKQIQRKKISLKWDIKSAKFKIIS